MRPSCLSCSWGVLTGGHRSSFFWFALVGALFVGLTLTLCRARVNVINAQRQPRQVPAKARPQLWDVFADLEARGDGEGQAWDVLVRDDIPSLLERVLMAVVV